MAPAAAVAVVASTMCVYVFNNIACVFWILCRRHKNKSFPRGNELNLHFFLRATRPHLPVTNEQRMLFCLSRSSLFSSSLRSPSSVRSRKASVKSTTVRNTASLDETSSTSSMDMVDIDEAMKRSDQSVNVHEPIR